MIFLPEKSPSSYLIFTKKKKKKKKKKTKFFLGFLQVEFNKIAITTIFFRPRPRADIFYLFIFFYHPLFL